MNNVVERFDYFLNGVFYSGRQEGTLWWGIEVLVGGVGTDDYVSRFDEHKGRYKPLGVSDYVLVDVRVNTTGRPPDSVHMDEHRMTVFFNENDFSKCTALCGIDTFVETVELRD